MSVPTSLQGHMDEQFNLGGFGAAVDYLLEHIPALVHPESVRTYSKMRHDPMIAAILKAYGGPINRAGATLDPSGCRDEVVQRIADDFGLPIKGYTDEEDPENPDANVQKPTGARRRKFTYAEHLRTAGLDRVYGHMFFEQAWGPGAPGWRLDVVQERMPQTIAALNLNKDGTLKSVEQERVTGRAPVLTTGNHQLVYYTRDREGSNYFGQPLIRPCYAPWLIKEQIMRVWPTSNRRNGMGVWQITAPSGATPQQISEAQRIAATTRASEHAGLGLPAGFTADLKGMSGTLPDHKQLADFCNQEMARSTITMLLVMVAAEKGNRSLGETVMDLMIMAQQADADFHAATATQQLVIPLVDANWGENEPAPQICAGTVGADVETTAQDIYWLMAYGGLKADAPARAWIRQLRNMPPEDPSDPVFAAVPADGPTQPDPNAPTPPGGAA